MKKTVFVMALLLSSSAFAGEIRVTVKGMVCAFCAQGITKKFNAEPEIASVDVSLTKKLVTLVTKENQDISDRKIETILKDAGYNVEKIERPAK